MVHELSKDGLAGVHPSLSVSGAGLQTRLCAPRAPQKAEIEKSNHPASALIRLALSELTKT